MNISGMIKSSLIDYPDYISCVLFVPGCNYSCFYCHNRSLIDGNHIILAPPFVEDFLKKRAMLLDGVVLSGGEPTLQSDLCDYMAKLKGFGYRIKLDTNGSKPDVIRQVLDSGLCDYFAVDYKCPASHYHQICGSEATGSLVHETIQLLLDRKANFEVRTTVYPQLKETDLIQMMGEIPTVPKYVLNRYQIPPEYLVSDQDWILEEPYSAEKIRELALVLKKLQPNMKIENSSIKKLEMT